MEAESLGVIGIHRILVCQKRLNNHSVEAKVLNRLTVTSRLDAVLFEASAVSDDWFTKQLTVCSAWLLYPKVINELVVSMHAHLDLVVSLKRCSIGRECVIHLMAKYRLRIRDGLDVSLPEVD